MPLGLLNIVEDGRIDFVDRQAVVRQGGIPNPRQALLAGTGTAFLWQARILGLTDHMQQLRDRGVALGQVLEHLQYLPPVGVLPPDIIDFSTLQTRLFPSQYTIEAAPVPLEQFEVAIEASASAQPFDLFVPDRIKVLVPVPQKFYEPQLLQRETVDPLFQQTIAELLSELGLELGRRDELRSMADTVAAAVDPEQQPDFPEQDPLAIPVEKASSDYDAITQHGDASRELLNELHSWLKANSPLTSTELGSVDITGLGSDSFKGVSPLIDDLQGKIDASNHKIDFGFLRVQTDIYRFRQMMLGNVEATRLATSPVLANIAQGLSSSATQENLRDYFSKIGTAATPAPAVLSGRADSDSSDPAPAGPPASGAVAAAPLFHMMELDMSDAGFAGSGSDTGFSIPRESVPFTVPSVPREFDALQPLADLQYVYTAQPLQVTAQDVEAQSPIIGESLEFRSTAVAERIAEPPAPEARSYAVASKAAVYADLSDLPINIEGINIPLSGSESAVLSKEAHKTWIGSVSPNESEMAVLSTRTRSTAEDVVIQLGPFSDAERKLLGAREGHLRSALNSLVGSNKRSLSSPGLSGLILSGLYDPHPEDGDESAFLSVGVSALESTVSTLRRVERRINGYKKALARCKQSLRKLQSIHSLWLSDLAASDDLLREHRHDVTVARTLLQEEQARVRSINERREKILQEHVSFVGYMRPRTVSLHKEMPSIKVHSEFKDPIPVCLDSDIPPPSELQELVNLFRDVPLKWLPYTRSLLLKLDSYDVLKSVFGSARENSAMRLQTTPSGRAASAYSAGVSQKNNRYQKAVAGLLSSHRQSHTRFLQSKAVINLQVLEKMSWREVSAKAQADLSLQDLIESGKGKSGLAQKASRELENIQDVAVCLYARLGEVPPAYRLQWADQVSEFDAPISLKNFDVLPQWDQLEFDLRRDLQRFVQWLFSRVDANTPDAVALMNDLVRVCLLLASHAPVSTIINGHLPEPVTGKVGDVVRLAIDKGLVRVGMEVGIFSGVSMTVQGVVEDLNASEAVVKVTRTKQATYHLDSGAKAQFYQPRVMSGLLG